MENLNGSDTVDSIDLKATIDFAINEAINKIIYKGTINQSLVMTFSKLIEQKLEKNMEDSSIIKKVVHIIVECLQNICKHKEEDDCYGLFILSENPNEYAVTTGNYISIERGEKLKSILDAINVLTKDEIKGRYIKQMKEGTISEKGGAGLGFLDMAKKTGNKFQYQISPAESQKLFFILNIIVSKK